MVLIVRPIPILRLENGQHVTQVDAWIGLVCNLLPALPRFHHESPPTYRASKRPCDVVRVCKIHELYKGALQCSNWHSSRPLSHSMVEWSRDSVFGSIHEMMDAATVCWVQVEG